METNLLDRMLDTYLAGKTHLTVTLQNKIRVSGRIRAFDSYVIIMDGPKREIVYRHAVSSLCPTIASDQKRRPLLPRPEPAKTSQPRPPQTAPQKSRSPQPQPLIASGEEKSLNNTLKDGLLKWMQEQKAAK